MDRIPDYRSSHVRAGESRVPYHAIESVHERAAEMFLRAHRPDLLWVIGAPHPIPDSLIRLSRDGAIGFHPTLLPEGRGHSPITWTIQRQGRSGVSLYFLAGEPETGDVLMQREVPVHPEDYAGDLIARINQALHKCIVQLAPLMQLGALPRTPQHHRRHEPLPRRTPADSAIDWSLSTVDIHRLIRAMSHPYSGAWTSGGDLPLIVWRARPADAAEVDSFASQEPGAVVEVGANGDALVRTVDGGLWLTEYSSHPTNDVVALKRGIGLSPQSRTPLSQKNRKPRAAKAASSRL
jgi:methionyl-tRNA formyltransferase